MFMKNYQPRAYISTNTVLFAQNIIRSIEDMTGLSSVLNKTSFKEKAFSTSFDMIIYIYFAGVIQGDYILAMNEETAAKLIGVYEEGMTQSDLRETREDYVSFIKELLNTAVGMSIPEIEQIFGHLTYSPSVVVYGEIEFPDVVSGNLFIECDAQKIQCGFSINLAKLKIGQKLEECMEMIRHIQNEAKAAQKEVATILELVPSCLVAVGQDGKILPGHSRKAAEIVGHDPGMDIVGLDLTEFLKLKPHDIRKMESFFHFVSDLECKSSSEKFPFEELQHMSEGDLSGQKGKRFKLDWLPVILDETNCLEKLIVSIEDISKTALAKFEKTFI